MAEPHLKRETEPGNIGLPDDPLLKIWFDEEQLEVDFLASAYTTTAKPEA
ncbi:hypothetical protein YC2023_060040 [Brassica napus]